MKALFYPPVAFLIYLGLVAVLMAIGQQLAGKSSPTTDHELYSSGERFPENDHAVPGYRPFFVTALFFAVLHLGVIVLAIGNLSGVAILYLLALILMLITLMLG